MDQLRGVIDEAHRRLTRDPSTTEPIDVRDAQTVIAHMRFFDFDEKLTQATGRLEWEFHGEFPPCIPDDLKKGP